eukprot:m.123829 g.123829  ORF g.123829 m.123829 type:complete len:100 (+) comp14458_c0_seq3:2631-2930(+)
MQFNVFYISMALLMHPPTSLLAYGMYESPYHVTAKNCTMTKRRQSRASFQYKAEKRVIPTAANIMRVATIRVSLNIFFIWYHGPKRNKELQIEQTEPKL